jgi:purine-binding chemotaxis protein CheW
LADKDDRDTPTRPTRPWCLFRSGSGAFAVGLEWVAEVVEVERLVRLPHSPPQVLGLCALRREVIPVIGLSPGPAPAPSKGESPGKLPVLILRTNQGPWAVGITPQGTTVTEEPLDNPSDTPGPEARAVPALLGTVPRGETTHGVIDPMTTWRNVRARVESWYADHWSRGTPEPPAATLDPTRPA